MSSNGFNGFPLFDRVEHASFVGGGGRGAIAQIFVLDKFVAETLKKSNFVRRTPPKKKPTSTPGPPPPPQQPRSFGIYVYLSTCVCVCARAPLALLPKGNGQDVVPTGKGTSVGPEPNHELSLESCGSVGLPCRPLRLAAQGLAVALLRFFGFPPYIVLCMLWLA
uniref:Uncharacterized protein n=1 Tax=Eutreptiella gymnastica TaxID=73025 RepID=A0A7S4G0M6_9EUGL